MKGEEKYKCQGWQLSVSSVSCSEVDMYLNVLSILTSLVGKWLVRYQESRNLSFRKSSNSFSTSLLLDRSSDIQGSAKSQRVE